MLRSVIALSLLVGATSAGAQTMASLTRPAAELVAQQFILEGTGVGSLGQWELPDRIQIWNIAVERLRRHGLTATALPALRAKYAADSKRLGDLTMRESDLSVDLYTALAGNDTKKAAQIQPEIDRLKGDESALLRHISLDTYMDEVARQR